MIEREMLVILLEMAKQTPVVTVTGPRQAGKTTLVRRAFPKARYVNLEAPDIRRAALTDPRRFLRELEQGAIIDEVQNAPELLSYIQVIVDETNLPGQFILTGSHQFALNAAISQSLAGRTTLLNLLPLTLKERHSVSPLPTLDDCLLQGFYPRNYKSTLNIVHLQRHYVQTYIERDLRQLINIRDLSTFQNFLVLCASNMGQLLNYQKMANAIGISLNTAKHWLAILEASYVVYRLRPYFSNLKKRLVKSHKLYFVDTGLAAYLLGIETMAHIKTHPLRGALFENMVIMDMVKTLYNQGLDPKLSFYRDSQGHEVDLVFEVGGQLTPIEIKSSETFHPRFLKNVVKLRSMLPNVQLGYVIYSGDYEQRMDDIQLLNYHKAATALLTRA